MRITTLLRCTALAALLGAALPAPASPQIGGFIKKKMKEKIARTLGTGDTASKSAPAPGTARAPGGRAAAPTASPAAGLTFNEYMLEITPALLDRLEKGLVAEAADRKSWPKLLFGADYDRCKKALEESPEYRKEYDAFIARYGDLPESQQPAAIKERLAREDKVRRARCGPPFNEADTLRYRLPPRAEAAGQTAAGLTERQYAILKERIIPLCQATETSAGAGGDVRIAQKDAGSDVFLAYKPTEVEAMRPRCGKLVAAFQALEAPASPDGKKKAR